MDKPGQLSPERQRLLAMRLKGSAAAPLPVVQIPKRPSGEPAPLSFGQHQMWVIDQMNPGNPAYNIPIAYRLAGHLDVRALENSFNEIIERHEIWRTTFREFETDAVQEIHSTCRIHIQVTDLEHLPAAEREAEAKALAAQEAVKPFDLSHLPLVRVSVFKFSANDHVLLINIHHIIVDGLSLNLLFDELDGYYRAALAGSTAQLPELPAQYADFAAWQREKLAKNEHAGQLEYWRHHLNGDLPVLEMPVDKTRPVRQSFQGSNVDFTVSPDLAKALFALGTQEKSTFFVAILAAFQVLLLRYSKAEDLVIGTPIANRPSPDVERLIGNFINVVALRCDVSGNPTFIELLRRSRETTLNALSNKDVPFEMVVKNLQTHRDPSRNPVFQALLQVLPVVRLRLGELSLSRFDFEIRFAQVDLTLHLYEQPDGGYHGQIQYCTDLFEGDAIKRLSRNFVHLLGEIVRNPLETVREISILNEEELRDLSEWNRTSVDYPGDASLQALFEKQATSTPDGIAVESDNQRLTYSELNQRANQLARYLCEIGITHGACVGVCMERSPELIVSILAILKAGGAYVPLDAASPPDRLALMLDESRSAYVLTRSEGLRLLETVRARVIDFDALDFSAHEATSPAIPGEGGDLAYVIFTSGSTGKPKGVAVPHRGIARLVINSDYVRFTADDVVAHASNVAFDAATFEIWGALLNGGKLVIIPREVLLSQRDLATYLTGHGITTMFLTTSLFNQIALENPAIFRPLKNVVFGGEAAHPDCVRRVLAHGAPQRLVNGYGPTEATTFAICHLVQEVPANAVSVPIGRPIANTTIQILDSRLQLVPCGAIGEIYIGGPGVAIGYINDPDLTAERFVETSFGRLYQTGDLARRRADGVIEFYGRMDSQLKLRGFRIEPGEIETAIQHHPLVQHAAVIARTDASATHVLIAYVVPRSEERPSNAELREFLSQYLPGYMIPSAFVWMEVLPLTDNGKLNLRALPEPVSESQSTGTYAPPQNSVHQHLIEIWEEVLNRKPIGIRDDFFELGGHSLLAARVIALTGERLGYRLPFADFFATPTIEAHTRTLFNSQVTVRQTPYALINPDGKQTPVFFFHGDFVGGGFFCKTLASVIGADRPFYALHPHGLQGDAVPLTIEEMAMDRLRQIREIQPHGPYIIGGYCNGALTAYHTARLLREAGEEVATLLMLNADGTNVRFGWLKRVTSISAALRGEDEAKTLQRFLQSHRRISGIEHIGGYYLRAAADLLKQPPREQLVRFWRKVGRILRRPLQANARALAQKSTPAPAQAPGATPAGPLGDAYNTACLAFVPRRYDGPMVLLWPKEEPSQSTRGPAAGWEKVCSQISVIEVPGHHHSCVSLNANVAQVGLAMRKAIDQAESLLNST